MNGSEYTVAMSTKPNQLSRVQTFVLEFSLSLKMSYDTSRPIPFVSVLRATGHGEVWDHTDDKKFSQFGWRCTNTESSYSPTRTLVGNWNEQRFDISTLSQAKPLPSQFNHYFETTHSKSYCSKDRNKVPQVLKHLEAREPTAYPGHQPELDPLHLKKEYNSFMTTSRAAFGDPNKMR